MLSAPFAIGKEISVVVPGGEQFSFGIRKYHVNVVAMSLKMLHTMYDFHDSTDIFGQIL